MRQYVGTKIYLRRPKTLNRTAARQLYTGINVQEIFFPIFQIPCELILRQRLTIQHLRNIHINGLPHNVIETYAVISNKHFVKEPGYSL